MRCARRWAGTGLKSRLRDRLGEVVQHEHGPGGLKTLEELQRRYSEERESRKRAALDEAAKMRDMDEPARVRYLEERGMRELSEELTRDRPLERDLRKQATAAVKDFSAAVKEFSAADIEKVGERDTAVDADGVQAEVAALLEAQRDLVNELDHDDPLKEMLESLRRERRDLEHIASRVALLPEWVDYEDEVDAAHAAINKRRRERETTPITADYVQSWHEELDKARKEIFDRHTSRLAARMALREAGMVEQNSKDEQSVEAIAEMTRKMKNRSMDNFQRALRDSLD